MGNSRNDKMSKEDELLISIYFGKYFSKKFQNSKYNLNWGQVDDWLKLKEEGYVDFTTNKQSDEKVGKT